MLEIRHLQLLTALREQGSLAAAAEDLYVTASAVSHQLKEIENYYGVSLVNRRSRPLSFTPAGKEVLKLADSVLPQFNRTTANLKRLGRGQTGQLRLASECHSCFDWLMPILNRYRREWQDVELDFSSGFEPEPHQMLLDEEIDVLITASRLPLEGISYLPLFQYESRLVLSPTHPLVDKKSPILPEDLIDETLIVYPVEAKRLDIMSVQSCLNCQSQLCPASQRCNHCFSLLDELSGGACSFCSRKDSLQLLGCPYIDH